MPRVGRFLLLRKELPKPFPIAYTELGDYRKAEKHFKIAISADHDGSVHYKLART